MAPSSLFVIIAHTRYHPLYLHPSTALSLPSPLHSSPLTSPLLPPHPMAMQNCDALSDDDFPQERHGCHDGGESDLVVKRLNWQVVHLHRTKTTIVKVELPVE